MADFIAQNSASYVRVRSPHATDLAIDCRSAACTWSDSTTGVAVHGATTDQVGDLAGRSGLYVHELGKVNASLEEAFMQLTADSVEYHAGAFPGKAA